jgi:predicted nucleic acid-binding protein
VPEATNLVDVETVAALRKLWLAGALTAHQFRAAIDDLADVPLTRYPAASMMRRAYALRANVTAYDAAYVGLAEMLECPLVTVDERLASATGPKCSFHVVQA